MNCVHTDLETTLVDLVAFKWLMAGRGWWIDLPRLQRDVGYASECARLARSSGLRALEAQAAAVLAMPEGALAS
jgi:hypothetical protein